VLLLYVLTEHDVLENPLFFLGGWRGVNASPNRAWELIRGFERSIWTHTDQGVCVQIRSSSGEATGISIMNVKSSKLQCKIWYRWNVSDLVTPIPETPLQSPVSPCPEDTHKLAASTLVSDPGCGGLPQTNLTRTGLHCAPAWAGGFGAAGGMGYLENCGPKEGRVSAAE